MRSPNSLLLLSICLVLVGISLAEFNRATDNGVPFLSNDFVHVRGAEYDSVANSILSGEGFANPFRVKTGPTAWVAPILPFGMSLTYWLLDSSQNWIDSFLVLSQLVAAVSALWVISHLSYRQRIPSTVFFTCVLVTGTVHYFDLFQSFHDTQLNLILISILHMGATKFWSPPSSKRIAILWGIFGGFLALASPAMGFVWAAVTFVRWFPSRLPSACSRKFIPLLLSAAVSILVVSPWVVRNYWQFQNVIPIKSNFHYEVWQSLCLDDDGVLDSRTSFYHPWGDSGKTARNLYSDLGEAQFMEYFQRKNAEAIRKNPAEFFERILNRVAAATIVFSSFRNSNRSSQTRLMVMRVFHALPFLALIFLLAVKRSRSPIENSAILIYLLFLLPYVLVSYYGRYGATLAGIKAMLIMFALNESIKLLFCSRFADKARSFLVTSWIGFKC